MRRFVYFGFVLLGFLLMFSCGKREKESPQALWDKAETNFTIGEYEKALQTYNQLVKSYPKDSLAVAALFATAEIYKNNLHSTDKAVKVYHRILRKYRRDQRSPHALFMLGYTYANDLKDLKKAEKYYRRFIEKYPDHVLRPSAEWELKYLGKNIDEIPELQSLIKDTTVTEAAVSD